jgi:hypothetical protein
VNESDSTFLQAVGELKVMEDFELFRCFDLRFLSSGQRVSPYIIRGIAQTRLCVIQSGQRNRQCDGKYHERHRRQVASTSRHVANASLGKRSPEVSLDLSAQSPGIVALALQTEQSFSHFRVRNTG